MRITLNRILVWSHSVQVTPCCPSTGQHFHVQITHLLQYKCRTGTGLFSRSGTVQNYPSIRTGRRQKYSESRLQFRFGDRYSPCDVILRIGVSRPHVNQVHISRA